MAFNTDLTNESVQPTRTSTEKTTSCNIRHGMANNIYTKNYSIAYKGVGDDNDQGMQRYCTKLLGSNISFGSEEDGSGSERKGRGDELHFELDDKENMEQSIIVGSKNLALKSDEENRSGKIRSGENYGSFKNSENTFQMNKAKLATAGKCPNDLDDVVLCFGEISENIKAPGSVCYLQFFYKIENCLKFCFNKAEKERIKDFLLTRFNTECDISESGKFDNFCDTYAQDDEDDECVVKKYIKLLFSQLEHHGSIHDLPSPIFQPELPNSVQSNKSINFRTPLFSFFLQKSANNSCHNCDVAMVLMHCLISMEDELESQCSLDDSEDIYSDNSLVLLPASCVNNENVEDEIASEILKEENSRVNLKLNVNNSDGLIQETSDTRKNMICTNDNVILNKNSGLCNEIIESFSSRINFDTITHEEDRMPNIHNNSDVDFLLSSRCESVQLCSDVPQGKTFVNSCTSQDTCETMPPDSLNFKKTEEKRKSKVRYGSMDNLMHFMKTNKSAWKSRYSMNQAFGVILSKYKNIIKVKDKSYDDGEHYTRVTTTLSAGCSGKCYWAIDSISEEGFCLKIVKSFNECEIEVWESLSDVEGVPKLYGIIFYPDSVYILQEFIYGNTLQSLIKADSKLKLEKSLQILRSLLLTLSELHQRHIIHNDIKADNIIIGSRLVLIDFGLSIKSEDGVKSGVIPCGSQCHWSPEKAASEGYEVKSDVWAAIVVFVHMLAGIEPWRKRYEDRMALHLIIKRSSPPLEDIPGNLPPDVVDLIKEGWRVNVTERPDVVQLLKHKAFDLIGSVKLREQPVESEFYAKSLDSKHSLEHRISAQLFESQHFISNLKEIKFSILPSPIMEGEPNLIQKSIWYDDINRSDDGGDTDDPVIKDAEEMINSLAVASDVHLTISTELCAELENKFGINFNVNEKEETGYTIACIDENESSSCSSSNKSSDVAFNTSINYDHSLNVVKDESHTKMSPKIPIMVEMSSFFSNDYGDEDGTNQSTNEAEGREVFSGSATFSVLPRSQNNPPDVKIWQNYRNRGITVKVFLEREIIYSNYLYPGSNTKWSEVAERASKEVHKRHISRFYLVLHPGGQKIDPNEDIKKTLKQLCESDENAASNMTCFQSLSSLCDCIGGCSLCCHDWTLGENTMQLGSYDGDIDIEAKVIEIEDDVQVLDWKVENGSLNHI